jgi:hypothetical protein
MTFRGIEVLSFDKGGILPDADNIVMVPYILSDQPPPEWKKCFESRAPPEAAAQIVANQARYRCPKNNVAIERDGDCWKKVAALVAQANEYYREIDAQLEREQAKKRQEQLQKEKEQREFEEWRRTLRQ